MRQRKFQVLGQVLLDVLSLDILSLLQLNHLQDVDVSKSGSVSSSQVLVHSFNGTNSGNVSVFLVHVVDAGSRFVSDPDTVGLDLGWRWVRDHVKSNNFTRCFLDFVQSLQEVPVTRLSDNSVGGKDPHSEQLGLWNGLSWETTTNDLIFMQSRHLLG